MPKKNQKTCWSVVMNFFSTLTQRELILGYLFFSSGFLSQLASAENVKQETYFTPGMKKVHPEPVEVCIHASPGCFINARSIFN
ncbi:MAG TPA: hypothetical protein VHM20_04700, partial [Gammaproteobacteria bacterium]|nr:hypothetical protein [Gammaproteobacteria bacterium]